MKKRWRGPETAALVFVVLSSLGCAALNDGAGAEPAENADARGSWRYVSGTFHGQEIPTIEGHPVTLTIEGEGLSGTASCNRYFGKLHSPALVEWRLGQMGATERNCVPAAEAAAFDYFRALKAATSASVTADGSLRISGTNAELLFMPDGGTMDR